MRAKFKLMEKTITIYGGKVKFEPVNHGSVENEKFFHYTPYGTIDIGTINEGVLDQMEVGRNYYVDFTPADITN